MSLDEDLRRVTLQEERLHFDRFDPELAWELGRRLKDAAASRGVAVAIDISTPGQLLFHFAMAGATPNNADWIRRKRNAVFRFQRSSYGLGLQMRQRQTTLLQSYDLPLCDYADHGGCFPIVVTGVGFVGAVTISGLPQREDHNLVVETVARMLGRDISDITLSPEPAA